MKGSPLAALDEAQMLQTPGLVESGASRLKRSVSRWSIFPLTYFVPCGLAPFSGECSTGSALLLAVAALQSVELLELPLCLLAFALFAIESRECVVGLSCQRAFFF